MSVCLSVCGANTGEALQEKLLPAVRTVQFGLVSGEQGSRRGSGKGMTLFVNT